ncbi:MAG: type IV pilus secretin PilQ [Gammaproteobacteria bacterium]
MNNKYGSFLWLSAGKLAAGRFYIFLVLLTFQFASAAAGQLTLKSLDVAVLPGDQMQLQLSMDGPAVVPKVFQTDNPSRIALDFPGVKSGLDKKMYPINIGIASNVYAVESSGRLRVVLNLSQIVPYETQVEGNKVYVTLKSPSPKEARMATAAPLRVKTERSDAAIANLISQQAIKDLDFRRGPQGEGRLLISLTNPDTVVDSSEKSGKVILNFMNTTLPERLLKRVDVADFATPVQTIDIARIGNKARITVTPRDGNYEYSSFQTDELLTVEFRPLTAAEKEKLEKEKFPYSGERLSLNFQNIEVRSVLQILADFTKLNIVAADSVGGSITLHLNDVPWDQAFDFVLKSKGLAKREAGNVILVAPQAEISQLEKEELEAQKVVEELEPLKTEYIQINYARAEGFRNILNGASTSGGDGCSVTSSTGGGRGAGGFGGTSGRGGLNQGGVSNQGVGSRFRILSPRGTAMVDARTNTLIIKDTASVMEEIRKLIDRLDKPVRQVLIESRIVIASNQFARQLQVNFGAGKQFKDTPVGGSVIGDVANVGDTVADLFGAATGGTGFLTLTLARGADYILTTEIIAQQQENKLTSLGNPKVMTSDRCKAKILQGVQIPFPGGVTTGGTVAVQQITFQEALLQLEVTPQITPSGTIIMKLDVRNDTPSNTPFVQGDQVFTGIDRKQIETNVQVENGETVVLGGVYQSQQTDNKNKVPFFGDLPGIGWMFRDTSKNDNKNELLIFITPKIVKGEVSIQ